MRKFLVILVLLAVIGVAADFLASRTFETRTRQLVQQRFDLEREPVVQVRDFPFLLSLARGRLATVDVAASEVDAGNFALDRLQLDLRGVTIPRDVLLGRPGTISVERAGGQVRITEEEINRLLSEQLDGAAVDLATNGVTVRLTVEGGVLPEPVPVRVRGIATVRGGRILLLPQEVDAGDVQVPPALLAQLNQQVAYRLPELPGGMVPDRVTTEPGAAVIGAHLDGFSVKAS
jgi:LmeA-like phospholipid-binding